MLFSNKDLKKIIVPLIIEQVLTITIGIIDTIMVAQAGEAAVSGVSLVDTVNLLLIFIFSALAGGGAVVISQFLGAGKNDFANKTAKQLLWVVLVVSTFITALMLITRKSLLSLVFGTVTDEVMANASIYFLFTSLSYPFLGMYNACASIFRAMGNSKISMKVSVVSNIINVCGNAVLIFVFHLGAAGAAIATLLSRIVAAAIIMYALYDKKLTVHIERFFDYKPDFKLIKRICAIGIPNGAENGMFQFGKVITQSLIASFGTVHIAANAAASGLVSLQYAPSGAIGLTMITVVGQCVGAGEKEQAKIYAKKLLGMTYIMMGTLTILTAVFAKPLVNFYGLSDESTKIACLLIVIHAVGIITVHPTAFCLTNSFRAANDVKYTMILSVISMWVFRVGLGYVFGKYMGFGVIGVWYAMICDWIFRAICFGTRFVRGTWLNKYKSF